MDNSRKLILVFGCVVFLLLGLITAAIGPVLPQLAQNAGVNLAAIGSIFSAIFAGALITQLVTGPLGDRIGQQKIVLGGLLTLAAGILGLAFSRSLPVTLLFAFLAGLGHGGITLGGNVFIATVFNGRSVSALNLVNLFFGIGAFSGPALVSFSLLLWNTGLPTLWLSAGLMLLSALFFIRVPVAVGPRQPPQPAGGSSKPLLLRSPLLWVLGLLILVYVGTENGMGGWTTEYVQRTTLLAVETAALVTAGFWMALTAGRLVSAALGLRLSSANILLISLAGAVAGGALMVVSAGQPALTVSAILLIGFSFGSVYPTVMAIVTTRFPDSPGKAASVVAAMGSIGGALLPWLQGVALNTVQAAAIAWFALGGSALMLFLLLLTRLPPLLKRLRASAACPGD